MIRGRNYDFSQRSLPRDAARRHEARRLRHRRRTGPTSATSNSTSRRTTTRSKARCGSNRSAPRSRRACWPARAAASIRRPGCTARSCSATACASAPDVELVGPTTLGERLDRRARRAHRAQRAVGRLLRRRRRRHPRLHDRRPQHDRTQRDDQRIDRHRTRLHDRLGRDRQRQPQAVARQVGDLGLGRLDVADLRPEVARIAVRIGRHQRSGEPRVHARVRAQARPGVRLVSQARPDR